MMPLPAKASSCNGERSAKDRTRYIYTPRNLEMTGHLAADAV